MRLRILLVAERKEKIEMKNNLKIVTAIALITVLISLIPNGIVIGQTPIKIGIIGPMEVIQGRSMKWGADIASAELGGEIDGHPIQFVTADSYQGAIEYSTGTGAAAGTEMLGYNPDFIVGGFRSEAVSEYIDMFIDYPKLFMITGAATDSFLENVQDDYNDWKYLFRCMPNNSTSLVTGLFMYFGLYLLPLMTPIFGEDYGAAYNQTGYTVVYENALWTVPMRYYLMPVLAGLTIPGTELGKFVGPWTGDPLDSGYPIDLLSPPDYVCHLEEIRRQLHYLLLN